MSTKPGRKKNVRLRSGTEAQFTRPMNESMSGCETSGLSELARRGIRLANILRFQGRLRIQNKRPGERERKRPSYIGPLMPPSLRMRQKWIAMSSEATTGNAMQWST